MSATNNEAEFYVMFVDGRYYEGGTSYDHLTEMVDKIRNGPVGYRIKSVTIRGYNKDQFVSEPYNYTT